VRICFLTQYFYPDIGAPQARLYELAVRIAPYAFNRAVKASRGDTILLLSAHSAVDPDFIKVCLDKLDEVGAAGARSRRAGDYSRQVRL